ncbi:MAG: DUF1836 domain-containing protein [Sphaerochaetaceae bacterium]|nr:DUF1836 domain-containing protein [Sphaerochaetaceae bacterium]
MLDKMELIKKTEDLRISDLSSFPSLSLYMDQVLEILSQNSIFLAKEEKLTSAMVNNYIKEGLLPRAKGKKYSKQHVALLTIISRLKQILSVKEISSLMVLFGKEEVPQEKREALYDNIYVKFESILNKETEAVQKKLTQVDDKDINFLILDLAISSYVQKIVCELVLKNALIAKEEEKKAEEEEKEKEKKEEKKEEKAKKKNK